MITIISATNRPDSNTLKVANNYFLLMKKHHVAVKLLSLETLPKEIAFTDFYGNGSEELKRIVDEFIIPADKFIIISPEYHGSFPGILKVFLDALHPDLLKNKKVAMIGVATGRAGNSRGMDHLTSIFHNIGMHVHPHKLPISRVISLMDVQGNFKDDPTIKVLEKQIDEFLKW